MKKVLPVFQVFPALLLLSLPSWVQAGEKDPLLSRLQHQQQGLSFIENKGQITDPQHQYRGDIDFKLSGKGLNVFVGDGQMHYQWNKDQRIESTGAKKNKVHTDAYRMDVVLVGANKNAVLQTEGRQEYTEYYYMPQYNGSVSSYSRVIYKDIYPHIDWVLYTKDNQLKYDFVVHPGGNPADIKLQYKGATALNMKDGSLTAETPFGSVTEQKPYSYDAVTGAEIRSSFLLKEETLSFNISSNSLHDIVIDPLLDWSTYYGGTNYDAGIDVAADASGNAYMCGSTISSANIATSGAYQTSFAGFEDAFLVKFNISGTRQWATYYGGIEYDNFVDLDIDASGNIFAAGETGSSSGIATSGAHQTTFGANFNYDIYLVKFNSSGTRQWATYYGGSGHDIWASVALDASGNIYLSGATSSSSAMATSGTYQSSIGGSSDGFLAKFNSSGVRQWGTYFGGSGTDRFYDIAIDPSGNIFACGETQSTSSIASSGAHQTSHAGGTSDGMLVKFTSSGGVSWSTYYGGSNSDYINSVASDGSGNAYIGGITGSTGGIATTTGMHQSTLNNTGTTGNSDGFLVKFDASGNRQWGTYFGGSSNDQVFEVATDNANSKVYIAGHTQSSNRISSGSNSYQTVLNGGSDLFMANFDFAGLLEYGTYYGGNDLEYDANCGLAVNGGKLYLTGGTYSSTGIANGNAYQSSLAGNADGFLASFIITSTVYINQPFNDTLFCSGTTFNLPYTVIGTFYTGNVFTVQLSDASGSFASPTTIGTLSATLSGTISCTIPVNTNSGGGYRIRIASSNPAGYSGNNGKNIGIGRGPVIAPTASSNGPICAGSTLNLSAATSTTGVSYSWTGPNGYTSTSQNPSRTNADVTMSGNYTVTASLYACPAQSTTFAVLVKPMPAVPTASSNSPVCETSTINLTSSSTTSGVTYSWSGPSSYTSFIQNPSRTSATTAMGGTYTVTTDLNGCTQSATTTVQVKPMPATPTAASNSPICANSTLNLTSSSNTSGVTYSWSGPSSYTSSAQNPSRTSATTAMSGTYTVTADLNGCTQSAATTVLVKPMPADPAVGSNSPLCEGSSINLTSSSNTSGVTYSWSGPNSFSSIQQNPVISNSTTTMSGTYTVTADLNGCSKQASTNVTVNAMPANVIATQDDTLCAGGTINLNATSTSTGVGYSWSGPSGFVFSGPSTSLTNVSTARSGNYIATANLNGCTIKDTVVILVLDAPAQPVIGSNAPICAGSTLNLTANAISGVVYQWSGPNFFGANTQNTSIPNTTTSMSGVYTLTVTNSNNCSASQSITATINTVPAVPTAGSNSPLCTGGNLSLTSFSSTGGVSYSWTGPNGFTSGMQNPVLTNVGTSASGTYNVTASRNGCSSTSSTSVTVNPVPSITSVSSNTPVCINTNMTLFAQSDISGVTYSWTGPNGFSSNSQNPIINNASTADAGTYTVTASKQGCTSTPASTNVTVGINTPTPIVGNNGPICIGSNLKLTASSIPNAIYTWTGPNGYTSIVQNPVFAVTSTTAAGTYTVTADVDGCVSLPASTSVVVNPASFVNIYASPNDSICSGQPVTFGSVAVNPGSSPEYKWFQNGVQIPGASGNSYTAGSVMSGDVFVCVMSNTTDCGLSHADSSAAITMTVLPYMVPSVNISADITNLFSQWQMVTFTAIPTNAGAKPRYQWKRNGENVIGATADTWGATGLANGDSISVLVISDYLCADPDTVESNKIGISISTGIGKDVVRPVLSLYPNPNTGYFELSGNVYTDKPLAVQVQNAIGQTVYRAELPVVNRYVKQAIQLPDVANGVYMLRISGEQTEATIRFNIQK